MAGRGRGPVRTGADAVEVSRPAWAIGVDSLLAAAVGAFAWWTVLREVVLVTGSSTTPFVLAWLVSAPLVMVPLARWNRRAAVQPAVPVLSSGPAGAPAGRLGTSRRSAASILLCAAVAAAVLATARGPAFFAGWVLGLLTVALVGREVRVSSQTDATAGVGGLPAATAPTGRGRARSGDVGDRVAAIVAAGVAVGSLFAVHTSSDDVYYVNAAAWTAESGHIALRDTMFGPEVYPSAYGGGYPLRSIETLFGALARLVHLPAATVAYLIAAPVCTLALVWVLWQLASVMTKRHALPAFLLSVAFVLAGSGGTWRTYSARIWDGKSIAVVVLVPLIWIFGIRLAQSRDRHWTVLLLLAGVSFVGLTSSASLLGMAMAAIIVAAGVATRNRALAGGGFALALAPAVSGVVIALAGSVGGANPRTPESWGALHEAYGAQPLMVALTLTAILLSPLVSPRNAAVLVWASALAALLTLTPGALALLNDLTRSGPVEWRLLVAAPVPTLIGACAVTATAAVSRAIGHRARARTATAAVATTVVLVGFALVGTPLWVRGPIWQTRPAWNVNPTHLANVRALLASRRDTAGPVLMPPGEMRALAISTTTVFAVVPREFDLSNLREPPGLTKARRLLLALVTPRHPPLSVTDVRAAVELLHVHTVCLQPSPRDDRRTVRSAGFRDERPVGTLVCSTRRL